MAVFKLLLFLLLLCFCCTAEQTLSRRLQVHERSLQQVAQFEPTTTSSGCKCLDPWFLQGYQFDGVCGNPTDALLGVYCYVNETTCDYPAYSTRQDITPESATRDYCQPSTGRTLRGCECEHEWGFGGYTYPGTCANPAEDPNGRWCIVNEHTCEEPPRTAPDGLKWDYCEGDPNAANPIPQTDTTIAGCKCLEEVIFQGQILQNCSNVDQDIGGDWCFVDPRTCDYEPIMWHQKGSWDYCTEAPDTTIAGCKCRRKWSIAAGSSEFTGTCQNPDLDPNGPYCVVEPHTCTGEPAGKIVNLNRTFDYCQEFVIDSTIEVDTTVNGCQCRANMTYVGASGGEFTFDGKCSNPENDPAGPWCAVDPKTCRHAPQGAEPLGDGFQYWDYCNAPPAPPTKTGCRCKNFWQYPPGFGQGLPFYGVCANPNQDIKGDWCEVVGDSCTRGTPSRLSAINGVDSTTYFDYCVPGAPTADIVSLLNATQPQGTVSTDSPATIVPAPVPTPTPQSSVQPPSSSGDCLTLQQWIERERDLSILAEAVNAGSLQNILDSQEINMTLFAPDDGAFQDFLGEAGVETLEEVLTADLPAFKNVLLNHVVPYKRIQQEDFGGEEETLANNIISTEITEVGGQVNSGDTTAQVVQEGVELCNGILYAIDNVLLF